MLGYQVVNNHENVQNHDPFKSGTKMCRYENVQNHDPFHFKIFLINAKHNIDGSKTNE